MRLLRASDVHLSPKIIALRTGGNYNTIKSALRRLAHSGQVQCDETGYFLLWKEFELLLNARLKIDGQEECLPRVHDLHLTFKTENIGKVLRQQDRFEELRSSFAHEVQDRGPDSSNGVNFQISSCTEIPSLSLAHLQETFLNPHCPSSLHQLWKNSTKLGSSTVKLKGGFQETIAFQDWKFIVKIYERTGTVKVIFSNFKHPFDAIGLRSALSEVNGVLKARTGVPFLDIAALFYIEKIHIGSDVLKDMEFSGVARTCCTLKQFDGWLFRTYEKVLGNQLYVRTEACQEGGCYEGNQINTLLQVVDRSVTPTPTDLAIYDRMI